MKMSEVITQAMAGRLKWFEAARILGISDRQMRRWKRSYEEKGWDGLLDRRRNLPSPRRIPLSTAEKVLRLYRTEYFDFNAKHFHEELATVHGFEVSYGWTKKLLQDAGLVERAKKRGQYRRRRERRPLPGMLVHLDGSLHRWFESTEPGQQTLLAFLDDATGRCLAARFVDAEATAPILALMKVVVEQHGTFVSLYTDRASHFVYTPTAGEPPDRSKKTQVEQVLDELGIELIAAHSPESRGRGERAWRTMQGRLPQELRRAGATTYAAANRYLDATFVPRFNQRFTVEAAQQGSAFVPVARANLDRVFTLRHTRTVNRDNVVEFERRKLQLPKLKGVTTLAGRKVDVRVHLSGTSEVFQGRRLVGRFDQADPSLQLLAA
jgi:transposase